MELYIMRHGETFPNIINAVSGKKECDLTEKGKEQAKEAGEVIKNVHFDLVYSSPLGRAIETVNLAIDSEIIIDNRLIERDYGSNEGKKRTEFNYEGYWNYNLNLQGDGVEKVKDLMKRIGSFIEEIKTNYPDKTILISTHSGVARAMNYYLCGGPEDGDLTTLQIPNCCIRKYTM